MQPAQQDPQQADTATTTTPPTTPTTPTAPPPGSTRLLRRLFMAGCATALLLDFMHLRHSERVVESWWGFYGIFSFCVCIGLALVTLLLRRLLLRPPDYYSRDQDD